MTPFRFRLERVLSWRAIELAVAEAKVEELMTGLRSTDKAMIAVVESRTTAQSTVHQAAIVNGADLAMMEGRRIWAGREEKRLAARIVELQQSIDAQNRCVAEVRRGVKLMERLKGRRHETWKVEANRETDELAAESAIAQWRRLNY